MCGGEKVMQIERERLRERHGERILEVCTDTRTYERKSQSKI